MNEETQAIQAVVCHKCGRDIPDSPIESIFGILLPTQVRRPTEDNPSYRQKSRYWLCAGCMLVVFEEAIKYLNPIDGLLLTQSWACPDGEPYAPETDIITCGDCGLPHLASVGNCGKD